MLLIYTLDSVRRIYTFKSVMVNKPSKVFIRITPLELSGELHFYICRDALRAVPRALEFSTLGVLSVSLLV